MIVTSFVHTSFVVLATVFQASANRSSIRCGRTGGTVTGRVSGGTAPEREQDWPWIVTLNTNRFLIRPSGPWNIAHSCGGTIVHEQWVITAAHCLDDENKSFPAVTPDYWTVTAGVFSRHVTQSSVQRWQTKKILRYIRHKNYRDEGGAQHHDIALLQLKTPFTFNNFVRPICLPYGRVTNPGVHSKCKTAGWGITSENSKVFSLRLQEVQIPIINYSTCRLVYPNSVQPREHLCGGEFYYGKVDACKGDSGGPLACELSDGSWYLAGIVSWGVGCGRKHAPGIYTNVKSYDQWVLSRIAYYTYKT